VQVTKRKNFKSSSAMKPIFDLFYETSGVCTDTRNIKEDSLFVALKGANFDGNDYVNQAIASGAKYAITDRKNTEDNQKIFYVENCLNFLQKLSNAHRQKFNIPVIGITGSNGKTTTKELINAVLSVKFKTLCTRGNLNNHLGVPFTLLELNESHEIAIIEMGANKPGDIQELVDIAEPNCGVITSIGAAHIEGFGSLAGVIQTKSELYNFLKACQGVVFVHGDDPVLLKQLGNYFNRVSYGELVANDVVGKITKMTPFLNFTWRRREGLEYHVASKMIGSYNLMNYLCASVIGVHFGIKDDEITQALNDYTPANNRSQIIKTGQNTVILDAYNANISSMTAALESFDRIENDNKWVILGDMRELGSLSKDAHQEVVDYLKYKTWRVILVGEEFGKSNKTQGMIYVKDASACKEFLKNDAPNHALILVKGSRGIALEQVVEHL